MAPDIDSQTNKAPPAREDRDLSLRWSGRVSLTPRILAVNIFALVVLAGGFFYLDSYRARIIDSRMERASREASLIALALARVPDDQQNALTLQLAKASDSRIRIYGGDGRMQRDTRALGLSNFVLRDPDKDPWNQSTARFLDAVFDTVAGADRMPQFRERRADKGLDWPDVSAVLRHGGESVSVWRAPDRTPVITAAALIPGADKRVVLTSINARDITQTVRVERFSLSLVIALTTALSVFLSLFLARTIVRPLRRLARAAVRVRLGRAREVVVPRLPERRDEIGMLARSLSDMSLALRARIDATEAFAADLAHEIKNPLASLRSAVDSLSSVRDPNLQAQLLAVVQDDVLRLDRLISDISEASRLDAQLSRAKFDPIDLSAMLAAMVEQRDARGLERGIRLRFDPPIGPTPIIMGEGARLERVFANLIDNAISFSPDGGTVALSLGRRGDMLEARVEDEGPGVPEEARETIFRRFHTDRPDGEAFGKHSGLGLAIARTIVEAHLGTINVETREDRMQGARFVVRLPVVQAN